MRILCLAVISVFLAGPAQAGETWKTVQKWTSPSYFLTGAGWDGRYIWHGEGRGPRPAFYKIDPKSGRTVATIYSDFQNPGGMACVRGALWVTEENKIGGSHWVKKISAQNGALLKEIRLDIPAGIPDGECEAVTSDGDLLYITFNGRWIIKVNPSTDAIAEVMEVGWACPAKVGAGSDDYYMDGITWAFGHLFAVTNAPVAINEFDPRTGKKLMEFRAPAGQGWGPEGLATDGSSFYYVENNTNSCYKIILIDGYFR